MKNVRTILASVAFLGLLPTFGQWNDFGGNSINSTEYLGANSMSTVPLLLKTVPTNLSIDFSAGNILRARLNPTTSYTIGGFPSQNKDGSLLLSPDVNNFLGAGAPGPYSLLHLAAADNTAQQGSYRDWMKTGITFTGNADQNYVGQKAGELDYTDLVLHWSDNPTKYLKDRLRMIFTSGYNSAATSGATSREGLEGMRLFPVDNDHVNVGLGDFYAGNLTDPLNVIEPTERLDILNGKLRIRQLPTDAIASTLTKFLVVDDTPGPDFGVVKWRNVPPGTGGGCEWALAVPGMDSDVLTAYNGALACPQGSRRVGIGTPSPAGKLAITSKISQGGPVNGVVVDVLNQGGGWSVGVQSTVDTDNGNPAAYVDGVRGVARNGTNSNTGVRGQAFMVGSASGIENTGVSGEATVGSGTVVRNRGGFFGATATSVVSQNFGSWSEGRGGAKVYGAYALSTGLSGTTESRALYAQAIGGSSLNYGLEALSQILQ